MWILDERLGPEWKPETARFVMSYTPDQHMLGVRVDPGAPQAWRRAPYLAGLHRWAKALAERNHFVMVNVGDTGFLVMPERIVELGNVRHGIDISFVKSDPASDKVDIQIKKRKAA
ncbi:MAG: hypothetical protein ACRCXM_04550 [Beijerinckiaceae bacterium]